MVLIQKKVTHKDLKCRKATHKDLKRRKVTHKDLKRRKATHKDLKRRKVAHKDLKQRKATHKDLKWRKVAHKDLKQRKATHRDLKRRKATHKDLNEGRSLIRTWENEIKFKGLHPKFWVLKNIIKIMLKLCFERWIFWNQMTYWVGFCEMHKYQQGGANIEGITRMNWDCSQRLNWSWEWIEIVAEGLSDHKIVNRCTKEV